MTVTLKSCLAVIALPLIVGGWSLTGRAQGKASVWDGVYSEAQAARGERLYTQDRSNCHGADLAGGEMAPALTGGEFGANWNDLAVSDLLDRVYTSMPLNAPKSLPREQDADILAYVFKKGGLPQGTADLPSQAGPLGTIKFLAVKP